jgi:hypothetical protein
MCGGVAWRCLSLAEFNYIKLILCLELIPGVCFDHIQTDGGIFVTLACLRIVLHLCKSTLSNIRISYEVSIKINVGALFQYLAGISERYHEIPQLDSWSRFELGNF